MQQQFNFGNTFLEKSFEERKQIIGINKNPLEHYTIYIQHIIRYQPWKLNEFLPGKEHIINTFIRRNESGNKGDKLRANANVEFEDYIISPITFNDVKF
jgi:hypothetical protein